jgi:hypothetical protein
MVAVVVTAALTASASALVWWESPRQVRLRRLGSAYEAKAGHHAGLEREFARLSEYQDFSKAHGAAFREGHLVHFPSEQLPALVPKCLELAKYHRSLREKYERAAWNPGLPVTPDPPEPPIPE